MITRRRFTQFLAGAAAPLAAAGTPVAVSFDFGRYLMQLDAGDGGSVCQFHGSDPVKKTISSARTYATLGGVPDDRLSTDFGRFCDVAFSTRGPHGMGLSQVWSTPCGHQTPAGSVGKHYSEEAWSKLDFSMYLAGELPPERFPGKDGATVRGHTVPMLLAAVKRARSENQRILFWNDLHTDYPLWMWKDALRKNPIPEQYWEEAALHVVYYAKYLTACHGIPIHAVSFQNEPDLPSRHQFTPQMLIRISKILRAKLDEAGLCGVRIMPYTSVALGNTRIPWAGKDITTLAETYRLLENEDREYQQYIDVVGGHMSHGDTPFVSNLRNVRFWRASGDADNHFKEPASVSFTMGPPDQIDEVIRLNTWLYRQKVNLAGIWQIALRMGHTVDNFVLPERFDIAKDYQTQAVDAAATVYPYVRPGMFLVDGSMGAPARAAYSVDAFGGRGHAEAIVITNSGEERQFEVSWRNAPALRSFEGWQATANSGKRRIEIAAPVDGKISLRVPADSVTTLVAATPSTKRMVVLVTKSSAALSAREKALAATLEGRYEVSVVSQELTPREMDRFESKRHPVDPMGAAAYVLSPEVDRTAAAQAHRIVMAPVIAIGEANARAIGVRAGQVRGGESLEVRDPLDPPAAMLDRGLPKACGPRAAATPRDLLEKLSWAGA